MSALGSILRCPHGARWPVKCKGCKSEVCDLCAETWATCERCSNLFCEDCAPTRQRIVTPKGKRPAAMLLGTIKTRTEYLCGECASIDDGAKQDLLSDLEDAAASESEWTDEIIREVKGAIKRAERAANL